MTYSFCLYLQKREHTFGWKINDTCCVQLNAWSPSQAENVTLFHSKTIKQIFILDINIENAV
jgi:hypothetical protein